MHGELYGLKRGEYHGLAVKGKKGFHPIGQSGEGFVEVSGDGQGKFRKLVDMEKEVGMKKQDTLKRGKEQNRDS